ncbi:hypothetical protein CLOM_g16062 [Closterium sp. NIES-68]|nr:hypothetical protein CLOM_g16062 [Closterium sp. NIES-68]
MDQLFAAALEEIALEGREGCSISALWRLLSPACQQLRLPLPLDPSFRQLLFFRLLRCPSLSLLSPRPLPGFAPLDDSVLDDYSTGGEGRGGCGEEGGGGGAGGGGLARAFTVVAEGGEDECGDEEGREDAKGKKQSKKKGKEKPVRYRWVGYGVVGGDVDVGGGQERIGQGFKERAHGRRVAEAVGGGAEGSGGAGEWRWEDAEREEGVVVVAHKGLRLACVGVYEESEYECGLSDLMIDTLELVGKTRRDGVSQAQLAKTMRVKNNNFHYVLRSLEARHLIAIHAVVTRQSSGPNTAAAAAGRSGGSSAAAAAASNGVASQACRTNMLYLSRFSPATIMGHGNYHCVQ